MSASKNDQIANKADTNQISDNLDYVDPEKYVMPEKLKSTLDKNPKLVTELTKLGDLHNKIMSANQNIKTISRENIIRAKEAEADVNVEQKGRS